MVSKRQLEADRHAITVGNWWLLVTLLTERVGSCSAEWECLCQAVICFCTTSSCFLLVVYKQKNLTLFRETSAFNLSMLNIVIICSFHDFRQWKVFTCKVIWILECVLFAFTDFTETIDLCSCVPSLTCVRAKILDESPNYHLILWCCSSLLTLK